MAVIFLVQFAMTKGVIVRLPTSLAEVRARLILCGAAEAGTLRVLSEAAPQCHFANAPYGASASAPHSVGLITKPR